MPPVTTKRLLKYESPYRSSRFSCSGGNTQTPVMTTYEDSTECYPYIQPRPVGLSFTQTQLETPRLDQETASQFELTFNRFSPVLKGGWESYRQKYQEGPIIGRGSFGIVKTLFPMVYLKSLQKHLPKNLQLQDERLGEGIKVVAENKYEFCGLPLCPPTRAVKVMNIRSLKDRARIKDTMHILREISIGSWVDHPNIVKVSEIYTNSSGDLTAQSNEVFARQHFTGEFPDDCTEIYIVMENCTGGDLSSRPIPDVGREDFIARMFVHVFRALSYLNSSGIAHRDVKPENFLWSSEDRYADIKITDFGLANSPLHSLKTRAGTAYYVAPEIVKYAPQRQYTVNCDSWSAGIMLHVFLLGFCPFHADTDVATLMRVANEEIDWSDIKYSKIPPDAFDLLRKLLVKDPLKRLTTTEALKHPWLSRMTFQVSYIPMTVEEATGVVDALTAFYRCPVLKQLALCLMVRQIPDNKIDQWRKKYLHLSMLCENEHFWVSINTVEKWLMCTTEDSIDKRSQGSYSTIAYENAYNTSGDLKRTPKRRVSVRQSVLWKSVSKLKDILNMLNQHKFAINFTEFIAAQMMSELSQRDDLILETLAGLSTDVPGRSSISIGARDLRKLLNPMYQCTEGDLEDLIQQTEMIVISCYLRDLDRGNCGNQPRIQHLLDQHFDEKDKSQAMELTLEEFFVLIKSSDNVKYSKEMISAFKYIEGDQHAKGKRRLTISKLYESDPDNSHRKRNRKLLGVS